MTTRQAYSTDVKDDEWEFVAPHLMLLRLDASQREHDLREVFNASASAGRRDSAVLHPTMNA
jgi:hypothetical protein